MTREEAIAYYKKNAKSIKRMMEISESLKDMFSPSLEATEMAIKALEQESVLNKIRAEIVELTKCPYGTECLGANCPSNTDCMLCGDHVLEIIDKYRAESEEEKMSQITESEIKSMTKEQNYMRGYAGGKSDVLDKMRAEIKEVKNNLLFNMVSKDTILEVIIEIIDKYKAESEE